MIDSNTQIILKLQDLCFQYEKSEVDLLSQLNLEIQKGQIIGLIGNNGVGKSTLFKLIAGEYPQSLYQGQIFFLQQQINALPLYQRVRLGLSYLPQKGGLFEELTIKQHFEIALTRFIDKKSLSLSDRVKEKLNQSGFEFKQNQEIKSLSGGERKRLMIHVYLNENSKLFLMDEPFSALDQSSIQELIVLIRLLKQKGISILICDHQQSLLKAFCDQIYQLEDGKLKNYPTNALENSMLNADE